MTAGVLLLATETCWRRSRSMTGVSSRNCRSCRRACSGPPTNPGAVHSDQRVLRHVVTRPLSGNGRCGAGEGFTSECFSSPLARNSAFGETRPSASLNTLWDRLGLVGPLLGVASYRQVGGVGTPSKIRAGLVGSPAAPAHTHLVTSAPNRYLVSQPVLDPPHRQSGGTFSPQSGSAASERRHSDTQQIRYRPDNQQEAVNV
jgi:hypothetical protein